MNGYKQYGKHTGFSYETTHPVTGELVKINLTREEWMQRKKFLSDQQIKESQFEAAFNEMLVGAEERPAGPSIDPLKHIRHLSNGKDRSNSGMKAKRTV